MQDVLYVVMFPGPGQRLDNTIVVMIDNTARLETETKLRRVEADFARAARLSTLGELTASIAHEIKQPISAMLTNAETSLRWLARDEPNLPKVQQLTERIAESAAAPATSSTASRTWPASASRPARRWTSTKPSPRR